MSRGRTVASVYVALGGRDLGDERHLQYDVLLKARVFEGKWGEASHGR